MEKGYICAHGFGSQLHGQLTPLFWACGEVAYYDKSA